MLFRSHKDIITQALAADIVSCYYFERGVVENSLQFDKQVKEALDILNDRKRYDTILGR